MRILLQIRKEREKIADIPTIMCVYIYIHSHIHTPTNFISIKNEEVLLFKNPIMKLLSHLTSLNVPFLKREVLSHLLKLKWLGRGKILFIF